MYFLTSLPKIRGLSTIWVVVDRLIKYAHFIVLPACFTARDLACHFNIEIFHLHRLPNTLYLTTTVCSLNPSRTSSSNSEERTSIFLQHVIRNLMVRMRSLLTICSPTLVISLAIFLALRCHFCTWWNTSIIPLITL